MRPILSLIIFIFAISVFAQTTTTTTTITTTTPARKLPAITNRDIPSVGTQHQNRLNYGTPVSPDAMKTTVPIQTYPRATGVSTSPTSTPNY